MKTGRGAQSHLNNPFDRQGYDKQEDWLDVYTGDEKPSTKFIPVHPKSIVNTTPVPGAEEMVSMNPYQGCEHGCIYCYARPTHNYWGYNAGEDFEQTILVKKNAPELLAKKLSSKKWICRPILVSGNTDCYQPIERRLNITREILKVFLKFRHPVGIITKNALVVRDMDILEQLAALNLVNVSISITTLDEHLRRFLEPRTSTGLKRLQTIKTLSDHNIPVRAMIAPVIPSLNSTEIPVLLEKVAEAGALAASYQLVRLKDDLGPLFEDWLEHFFPDRKDKVLNKIREVHDGQLWQNYGYKSTNATRHSIKQLFDLHHRKYFSDKSIPELNRNRYDPNLGSGQMGLF